MRAEGTPYVAPTTTARPTPQMSAPSSATLANVSGGWEPAPGTTVQPASVARSAIARDEPPLDREPTATVPCSSAATDSSRADPPWSGTATDVHPVVAR